MLKRTYDRKVTTVGKGKKDIRAAVGNSFGLPSGLDFSCPYATPACLKVCYAGKLEKLFPGTRAQLLHNWELVKDADFPTLRALIVEMLTDFIEECDKYRSAYRFRIHWDGDFFNDVYTLAWSAAIREFPNVEFWTYTRNPWAAHTLHAANHDNLSLFFSTDSYNVEAADRLDGEGVKLAVLADTFASGRVLSKAITGKNGVACPEQKGMLPLISAEHGGACNACSLCITGSSNIRFSSTKR